MNYAVWAYNKLPQHGAGLSPEELFSGIKCPQSHLPHAHVFGCPVYVLDPHLQDGKKIPKWECRARQGIFVGFSPHHSTSVPLILNPRTQHISPQFHVIFDDAFTTVPSLINESERDHRFEQLFSTSRECYVDPSDITPNSKLLDDHWLSPPDLAKRNLQHQQALARSTPCLGFPPPSQSEESLRAIMCRHHRPCRLRPWLQRENLNLLCPNLRFQRECPCLPFHLHQLQPQMTRLPTFLRLDLLMTLQPFLPRTPSATPLATALALGKMVQPSTVNTPRGNGKQALRRYWPFPSMHWRLLLRGPNPLLPLPTLVPTTLGAILQLAFVMANSPSSPSSNMTGKVLAPLIVTAFSPPSHPTSSLTSWMTMPPSPSRMCNPTSLRRYLRQSHLLTGHP
eukprot:CCRYP_007519-RC/>CCRYP_007519-RC protein AED:0.41 eAED:0.03 QI:0/-1/0/1/-1/1/1/0/395